MLAAGSSRRVDQLEQGVVAVDIVVNNFNYGRYVAAAIDSALAQSHPHVTVIAVDDGSTDGSHEILREYSGRVELVFKENGGQASAVNAGFARCTGEVVIFLDADDVLLPDAAALVAAAFAGDPGVAKVQYRMEVIDRDGRPVGVVKPTPHLPLPEGDVRRAELTFPFDLVWLPMSGTAFRADVLRRILPVPENEYPVCGADWYLVHLATLLGTVRSLDDIAACYRVHGTNRYEPQSASLDLDHVRHGLVHAAATTHALTRLAEEVGLELPYARILSVADLSNRLVSLKLDRYRHPIPTDSLGSLLLDGTRAAARRADVGWPLKLLYVGWFTVMTVAPRRVAERVAVFFLFPERRGALNRVLGSFHTARRSGGGDVTPPGAAERLSARRAAPGGESKPLR